MNYIYDIILNFNRFYYDFYEWKISYNIININTIKLLKVNDKDYLDIKKNNIIFDNSIFKNKLTKYNSNYIFLVTNEEEAMGIMINDKGKLIGRSSLIFEEEEEVIEVSYSLGVTNIIYKKNEKKKSKIISRIERTKLAVLNNFIKKLDINNDKDILRYLYFDCFEKEAEYNINIKEILLKEINDNYNLNNIYESIKLLNIK